MNPRKLILLDGIGALLSAFLLGIVLPWFNNLFGMPHHVLYFLAFLPCLFAIYDFICYFRVKENWGFYLKVIALVNFIYCCLSIGFLMYHHQDLTSLDFVYFSLEFVIVMALVVIEFKVAIKLTSR